MVSSQQPNVRLEFLSVHGKQVVTCAYGNNNGQWWCEIRSKKTDDSIFRMEPIPAQQLIIFLEQYDCPHLWNYRLFPITNGKGPRLIAGLPLATEPLPQEYAQLENYLIVPCTDDNNYFVAVGPYPYGKTLNLPKIERAFNALIDADLLFHGDGQLLQRDNLLDKQVHLLPAVVFKGEFNAMGALNHLLDK